MLKTRHLAYIAHKRELVGVIGKANLIRELGEITDDEMTIINKWESITNTIPTNIYNEYSTSELAVYLSIRTGFHCSLSPISTVFGTKDGSRALLAFYILKGYNINHPKPLFTDQQEILCNFNEGPVIVNAGPGTGKTTVGVERAFRKAHEGVIIVSYSNEAVREIYKRFKEYPNHRGKVGFKKMKKPKSNELYPIVVTTLDSLAWTLSGRGSIEESNSSHGLAVKDALSAIAHGKVSPHRHLIVDEAQDIDEERGEMVKLIYATGKFSSMLILGDPRQRISQSGLWYTDLWITQTYTSVIYRKPEPTIKVEPITSDNYLGISEANIITNTEDLMNSNLNDLNNMLNNLDLVDDIEEKDIKLTDKNTIIDDSYIKMDVTVKVHRIGLTISHRFKNQTILDLHNDLSSNRPDLDVQLESQSKLENYGKFKAFNIGKHYNESGMKEFADFIKSAYIDSKYCSPKDICVIMPSITSQNATSKKGQRLCAIFKESGILCYTRKEGSYLPNGVLVTTIHSVKGKEFKIVIIYCMGEFPKYHPQIPNEQADSLIYVANTRAKNEIIYLCNENFIPPNGVNLKYFNAVGGTNLGVSTGKEITLKPNPFKVTDMVTSHGWSTLLRVNDYKVEADEYHQCPSIPDFEFSTPRVKGILCGMIIQTLVSNKHLDMFQKLNDGKCITLTNTEYISRCRKGDICNGIWIFPDENRYKIVMTEDGVNNIRPSEAKELFIIMKKEIKDLEWKDWILLVKINDYICGDHMLSRYEIDIPKGKFPYEDFKAISDILVGSFGPGEPEVMVMFSWAIGSCDILFKDVILELKTTSSIMPEHRQQLMIYNACLPKAKIPYIFNLTDGRLERIKSKQHVLQWKYIIDVYGTIRNHCAIVVQRKNNLISKGVKLPKIPLNYYVADTEFDKSGIFDFAMVNLSNPYMSIVQPLFSLSTFAVNWLSKHHEFWKPEELKVLFSVSRKYGDLDNSFYQLGNLMGSTVCYYKAKEDAIIPSMYKMQTKDWGSTICRYASTIGASTESAVSVKLGEFYDLLVHPLEFQEHLHQHSALTDSLVLYELYHLGHIKL